MALLFDFLPILAFFVAYKMAGIYVATGVLIVAVLVQATIQWIKHRKLSPMMLTSAILVLVFGGITLVLQDKTFIQWKPTILYGLLALAFIGSRIFGAKPMIERMLGGEIQLEPALWKRLNDAWTIFFIALAGLNIHVAYSYSEATWVNFKLFGLLGITAVFAVLQAVWLATKVPTDSDAKS